MDAETEVRRLASHAEVVRNLYSADAVALVIIKGRVGTGEAVVWARNSDDARRDAADLLAERLVTVAHELEMPESAPPSGVPARRLDARGRQEFDACVNEWWDAMRQKSFHGLPAVVRVAIRAVASHAFRAYMTLRPDLKVH